MEGVLQPSGRREPRLAHNVVVDMVDGLDGKGHVVVMDNYFSSVGLFTKLALHRIYAMGMMVFLKSSRTQSLLIERLHKGTSYGACMRVVV